MKSYGNLSCGSGVAAYEIRPASIVVQFLDGSKYEYTARSVGARRLSVMKNLARAGKGLSAYIAREVRGKYARKFP